MFSEGCESFKAKASAAGLTDDQWKQMTAYSACVFNNCGNFRSFGDTKFVPEFDLETFTKFVKASGAYGTHKEQIDNIMDKISKEIYSEEDPLYRIGFKDENNGCNSYYSSNITKAEAKMIDDWCQEIDVSPLNTRLLKTGEKDYEMKIASSMSDANVTKYLKKYTKEDGTTLTLTACDFKSFMESMVESFKKATEYTRDEN